MEATDLRYRVAESNIIEYRKRWRWVQACLLRRQARDPRRYATLGRNVVFKRHSASVEPASNGRSPRASLFFSLFGELFWSSLWKPVFDEKVECACRRHPCAPQERHEADVDQRFVAHPLFHSPGVHQQKPLPGHAHCLNTLRTEGGRREHPKLLVPHVRVI